MAFPACRPAISKPLAGVKFAPTAIGYVHIDIAELRLAQGKLNMFLAIDRVSKFTYVEFRDDAGKMNGADFLHGVINAFPYEIHTVLTDNGMAFADLPKNRNKPIDALLGMHIFGRVCNENGIVQTDQALSPVDERPGRTDEQDHQGRYHQSVSLP